MSVLANLTSGINVEVILIYLALVSLTAVFIALITSLIKKIFGNKLSPSFHYYIWLVFVARLIFPFTPESNISIYNAVAVIYQNITVAGENSELPPKEIDNIYKANGEIEIDSQVYLSEAAVDTNIPDGSLNVLDFPESYADSFNNSASVDLNEAAIQETPDMPTDVNIFTKENISSILLALYLAIALCNILIYFVNYFRYTGKVKKSLVPVADFEQQLLDEIKLSLNIKREIKLFRGKESMLVNVFSPYVIVADDCPEADKNAVITHELLHYKHKDNVFNIILSVIKYVYWFNPFIGYFIGRIKDDMEILCDMKSINKLQYRQYRRSDYAMMLFNSSNNDSDDKSLSGIMQMTSNGKQLKNRIKFISSFKKPSRIASLIAAVLVVVLMLTALTNPIGAWGDSYIPDPRITVTEVDGVIQESIDYEFIPDKKAVGKWEVVAFVWNINSFKVEKMEKYAEMPLYWLDIEFLDNGMATTTFDTGVEGTAYKLSGKARTNTYRWTKGLIDRYNSISEYEIKNIDGEDYMFIQWKSGDYTVRHMKPQYYVFKKVSDTANDNR